MNTATLHAATRLALVTGASHRVGRAIAIELARSGFRLILTYRTRREACEETARLAVCAAADAGYEATASTYELDLSDVQRVESFGHARAAEIGASGALDLLVHNASDYRAHAFGAITSADLAATHSVEVVAPLLLTQSLREALSHSQLAGGGAVIFFSDTYALDRARAGFTPYMIAKAAVETLARQLAVELAPSVRVHCIAPGVILWPDEFPESAKAAILARTPLARTGTAEDAARLVRFLALESSFTTGETIRIDGGRALR